MDGRRIVGLVILVLGVGFLLDATDVYPFGQALGTWWPLLLVAVGLIQILTRSAPFVMAGVLIVVGTLLQLDKLDLLPQNLWSYVWPLLLIVIGLAWLVGGRRHWRHRHDGPHRRQDWNRDIKVVADERINQTAVFGGYEAVSRASPFRGGQLTAVFGGVKLDLREAHLAPEGADVEASALFGGVEILVPPTWRVDVRGVPVFGGIDDKTASSSAPAGAPVLRVKGSAIFGGITVHHGRDVRPPPPPIPPAPMKGA